MQHSTLVQESCQNIPFLIFQNILLSILNFLINRLKKLLKIFKLELALGFFVAISYLEKHFLFVDQKILKVVWVELVYQICDMVFHPDIPNGLNSEHCVKATNFFIFVDSLVKAEIE